MFFCSGVSNSSEVRSSEFNREKKLLIEILTKKKDECIVYFSSILAPSESNDYYKHKFEMEQYIAQNSNEYLILRLPQVAGATNNQTLLPFFIKNIYEEKTLTVYKECTRSLIDVDDVVKGFDALYSESVVNKIIDFCPDYTFHPLELAEIIANYLGKNLKVNLVDSKSIQTCSPSQEVLKQSLFGTKNSYLTKIVKKYSKSILALTESESK